MPRRSGTGDPAPDRVRPSWVTHCAIYEVLVRYFSGSGDFRGVICGLDRIQATGADVIWLMPIYPVGVSNHKGPLDSSYAVRHNRAINPAYGTVADFRGDETHPRLGAEPHRLGQRLDQGAPRLLRAARKHLDSA